MNTTQTAPLLLTAAASAGAAVFFAARLAEPAWDRVSARYLLDLQPLLKALKLNSERIPQLMRWWGILLASSVMFVGFGLGMWPVAFALAYLIYVAPRLYLKSLISMRSDLLRDQMVGVVTGLANATRAGLSLAEGLDNISAQTPDPMATELRLIVRDYKAGRPLKHALSEARDRLRLDSFTLFVSALLVSLERGGRITDALERIGRSLQENQKLERELQTDTESGRKVVAMLAVFPFGFLGLFYFLNPRGTTLLFTTVLGQIVLFVVIVMVYVSVRWANKIMTLQV